MRGTKPERWVCQTDFNNPEAVGYLADRLGRLGVEDELFKAGAVPVHGWLVRSYPNTSAGMMALFSALAERPVEIDETVAASELSEASRNLDDVGRAVQLSLAASVFALHVMAGGHAIGPQLARGG